MSGSFKVLVDKDSAKQRGSGKNDILPINRSHSEMVKFGEGSEEYLLVARYIHELINSFKDQVEFSSVGKHASSIFPKLAEPASPSIELDKDLAYSLLRSLDLKDTRYRVEGIEEAYGPTFQWIWTEPDVGFASWLISGTATYWISGKPGSGKSTLMKYIFKNYREMVFRNVGSPGGSHISAGFFFHDRGSHLQKSHEGLLYSILYQVLSSESSLIEVVSHIYLKRQHELRAQWSLADLEEAIDCILKQKEVSVEILLFLDALDEYGGHPEFIVQFIQQMISHPENSATMVRICFSSRLWNVFIDEFQESPGFKIHERTRQDIRAYINGNFNSSPSMCELSRQKAENEGCGFSDLISNLIDQAEGVFLWLKLVVKELLNASRERATVAELWKVLASFPKELEELYTELIKRIPHEFRKESYAMLEIVLRSQIPVHPYDFWLATLCAPCATLEDCISKIPVKAFITPYQKKGFRTAMEEASPEQHNSVYNRLDEVIGGINQYQRRLKSRCGGLIEEVPYCGFGEDLDDTRIQFMHQTVKDFVIKPEFRQLITVEDNESKENGYSFLVKYGLAQLTLERRRLSIPGYSSLPEYAPEPPTWFWYLFYASRAELSTGISQKPLLDAASEAFMPARTEQDVYGIFGSNVSFGVISNLQLYIQECLIEHEGDRLRSLMGHGNPNVSTLLHDLVAFLTGSYESHLVRKVNQLITSPPDAAVVDIGDLSRMANILLDFGANTLSIYRNITPFQMIFRNSCEGYDGHMSNSEPPVIVGVALAFLLHGQSPNIDVLAVPKHGDMTPVLCKPLHLANYPLAKILLENGAHVNELDEHGFTPLDIAFDVLINTYDIGDHVDPKERQSLPLLLMDHGGCVNKASASSIHQFLNSLTRGDKDFLDRLDPRLKNPPRLSKVSRKAKRSKYQRTDSNQASASPMLPGNDTSKLSRFSIALPSLFKPGRS